jgi:hypothetical protein
VALRLPVCGNDGEPLQIIILNVADNLAFVVFVKNLVWSEELDKADLMFRGIQWFMFERRL